MSARLTFALLSTLVACNDGTIGDGKSPAPAANGVDGGACAVSRTDEVRQLLAPTCESCHGAKSNTPFFSSLAAFESLVVQNPSYVVPGDPDGSYLLSLLEGNGKGLFAQMPPTGPSFAALAATGETSIDVASVRGWIAELGQQTVSVQPNFATAATRRLTAEELLDSLASQLGLSFDDDFSGSLSSNFESPTLVLEGQLPARSPDALPPLHYGDQGLAETRFLALGGPDHGERRARDQSISAPFLQNLVQVSQAWCQMAVEKDPNPTFFAKAERSMTSATDAAAIRANIAAMHLRMLGEPAAAGAVDAVFQDVFVRYEPEGADVAWTAVCAHFVRHPLWLTF